MRRGIRWILPVALVAAVGASAAMAATTAVHASRPTVMLARSAGLGRMLVGPTGRTLYRYTVDRKGVNRCTKVAACARAWPELLVKAGDKPTAGPGVKASMLGTIKAAHGKAQVTYAGFPLYYFAGDTKAGMAKGQGIGSVWYVVDAAGALVKHAAQSAASTAPASSTTSSSSGGGSSWG